MNEPLFQYEVLNKNLQSTGETGICMMKPYSDNGTDMLIVRLSGMRMELPEDCYLHLKRIDKGEREYGTETDKMY